MRTTFAVGRLRPGSAEIVLLEDEAKPSFPGPWSLRAVVRERTDGKAASGAPRGGSPSVRPRHEGGPPPHGSGTVH